MHLAPSRKPNGRLKIKVEQATCDQCRLNKVQCLAPDSVEERCKQCEASGIACTWVIGPRPLGGSPPSPSFVAYLENRVGELERKLRGILPGINLNRELETLAQLPLPPSQPAFTHLPPATSSTQSSPAPVSTPFQHVPTQNEPPVLHSAPELLKQVRQVSLPSGSGSKRPSDLRKDVYWSATASTKAEEPRFHGMSSGEILLRDAKELRREYLPSAGSGKILRRRQQFWEPPAPEKRCRDAELAPVELPPADLVDSLVDLFFRYTNAYYPIFHRGVFDHERACGTHLASDSTGRTFARVLLLVCAVASRWSSDPRVFKDGQTLSAGYEFFHRAGPVTWAVRAQASLYDVQICILSALFLHGSSAHYSGWIVLGIGIRLAQDVGAHRKKEKITIENELYKRAFWNRVTAATRLRVIIWTYLKVIIIIHRRSYSARFPESRFGIRHVILLVLDRMICGALGRSSAMQDLDSDLDPIIELDDEDWPIDSNPFHPLGKPSRLSYFNGAIGLSRILGRALQTLYALDGTKRQMGLISPEKEGELLADLQKHLEQWKNTVPQHLQLTTPMAPGIFFDQATSLWSMYHHTNILIHREFITKRSILTADCLDRCRRSARECAAILDAHLRVEGSSALYNTAQSAFSSGMVLIFDILAGEKASRNDPCASTVEGYSKSEKAADVERCKAVLERAESRWYITGQWLDTLREFQQSGNSMVPASEPGPALETLNFEIHEPYEGGSSVGLPGPGDPYPFNFSFSPHHGQGYSSGQASGMVASTPTTAPTSFPSPGTFSPSFTTPTAQSTYAQGPYLPDAYYGDNTNVPFPAFVSQFNFAPNQGRDDGSGWAEQTPPSQWQRDVYYPWFQGGTGSQPQ
ncbi:unnamed protein product [Rhizoctonia solani]|uniref:Zn(2)-C6 fungal-type domain-containing protein n=1 Tax=Rhizoctonia solani TaxID=456999 RepID=A0A8H3DRM9_9AGAM|nr:unnamed protein product [Rhizoctonia solani]